MRHDGTGVIENIGGAMRIAFALATPFLRGRRVRWGATDEELARAWPGDELLPRPRWQHLHAVTVAAPASRVWPWIAQLGQERGGLYSYQRLENLAGCQIHNADSLVEAWQKIAVGDEVHLHPKMPALRVARVEPGHALVLDGSGPPAPDGSYAAASWTFIVEDSRSEPGRSRLYSRYRADYAGGRGARVAFGPTLLEPVSFVMDTKMLDGIRRRAEAVSNGRAARG